MTMRDEWTAPSLLAAFDEHLQKLKDPTTTTISDRYRPAGQLLAFLDSL